MKNMFKEMKQRKKRETLHEAFNIVMDVCKQHTKDEDDAEWKEWAQTCLSLLKLQTQSASGQIEL